MACERTASEEHEHEGAPHAAMTRENRTVGTLSSRRRGHAASSPPATAVKCAHGLQAPRHFERAGAADTVVSLHRAARAAPAHRTRRSPRAAPTRHATATSPASRSAAVRSPTVPRTRPRASRGNAPRSSTDRATRVAQLARARDRRRVIAIREDPPLAPEHAVDRTRRHDRERTHAMAERLRVVRLEEEVQVIALDRRVADAKRGLAERALQCATDRVVRLAAQQPRHFLAGAKDAFGRADQRRAAMYERGPRWATTWALERECCRACGALVDLLRTARMRTGPRSRSPTGPTAPVLERELRSGDKKGEEKESARASRCEIAKATQKAAEIPPCTHDECARVGRRAVRAGRAKSLVRTHSLS